mmetsp:Transcript_29178/g.44806  ORF Transcript_29178/g.44806 Transcript_29178/m.44806 type:complete len:98 (+) Transcript_29178:2254-2547(+)
MDVKVTVGTEGTKGAVDGTRDGAKEGARLSCSWGDGAVLISCVGATDGVNDGKMDNDGNTDGGEVSSATEGVTLNDGEMVGAELFDVEGAIDGIVEV